MRNSEDSKTTMMGTWKKNRVSSNLGDDIAETIDERTAVDRDTPDLEKQEERIRNEMVEQQEQDGLPAPIEIPDGGVMAWGTVFGAWCILFCTFGMTQAFGVYQDYYVRFFLTKYTPSDIGWIGSVQLFFQFFMGIAAGKLFDAGYFYLMMIGSSILYAFCYYMLSLSKPEQFYQVFLAQGIGAGIALGFLYLPAIGIIAHHFKRKKGFAMGIVISGSSCGGLVFPVMLNHLIESHGFAWAVRSVAFLTTLLMVLAMVSMRTRLPPRSKMPVNPDTPPLPSIKEIITDARYMIACFGAFLNILGIFTPIFYMQLYAIDHGVDPQLAFYTITIINGASIIGRIVPNFISDRLGPFNVLLVSTIGCAVLAISMLAAKHTAGIIAICVLYGVFSGAYISLLSPLFANLANHVSETGIRLGVAFTIVSFSGLAGTPITGALLTPHLHWERPIGFSGACLFSGFFFLAWARFMTAKQRGTWKV